jgi:hypothetical protein
MTASITSGVGTVFGYAFAIALLAWIGWFVVQMLGGWPKQKTRTRRSHVPKQVFVRPVNEEPHPSPCAVCSAVPNTWTHGCDVHVKIVKDTYDYWGPYGFKPGQTTTKKIPRGQNWPKRRSCFFDTLRRDDGQAVQCFTRHSTQYAADKCGITRLRKLQTGELPYDDGYFTRKFEDPPPVARKTTRGLHPKGLSPPAWSLMKKLHDYRCFYCGEKSYSLERDHAIPIDRGGKDHASNIVPACKSCNRSKGTMTPEEFEAYLCRKAKTKTVADMPPPRPGFKVCHTCQEALPVGAFGNDRMHPDGLTYQCRNCRNTALREKRQAASTQADGIDT